ncbi:anti-sigma B factor antagonist [Peptoniphilus ivorii]|uniref:STAS domain-containing protein n=1 Tax=Aedoeadaptatus ivorii TaxID=54006 RepID=UPI00278B5303|nr:STAS domain-containing protein [Peptoniphilus ivorii]MDQ0508429.1 anti-sigma B factor antagonist [Peptoniphilus ivorii]
MFNLEIRDEGNRLRMIPTGEMDMYYTPQFKEQAVKAYTENKKDILIDGADLEYVDSTGLGGFMYLLNVVKEQGHEIAISNLDPNVKKLFTITKLDKMFTIEGDA